MKKLALLSSLLLTSCLQTGGGSASSDAAAAVTGAYNGTYTLDRVDCYVSTNWGGGVAQTSRYTAPSATSSLVISNSSYTRSFNGACTLTETGTIALDGVNAYSMSNRSYTSSNGGVCSNTFILVDVTISPNSWAVSGSNASSLGDINSHANVSSTEIALRYVGMSGTSIGWCYQIYKK